MEEFFLTQKSIITKGYKQCSPITLEVNLLGINFISCFKNIIKSWGLSLVPCEKANDLIGILT